MPVNVAGDRSHSGGWLQEQSIGWFVEVLGNSGSDGIEVEVGGISINGVDMIKWNDNGQIVEFKVMVLPLKAINLLQQKMAEMLAATS